MFIFIILCILGGIVSLILFAALTKKEESVVYNTLDKVGKITNVLLIIFYVIISPLYLVLGLISYPAYDGFLGIIGWIISFLNSSTALICGLSVGLSIMWRKKGKSKLSFIIQFLGVVAIAFTVISSIVFDGNLLRPLN